MAFPASATISAHYAGTGRYVTCTKEFGEIQEWARRKAEERLTDAICSQISDEFEKASTVRSATLVCFRGRTPPFRTDIPTVDQMGPPEAKHTDDNRRYSRKDRTDLYLCDCPEGVRRELADRKAPIWVQEFAIPAETLRIADLSVDKTEQSLSRILWFAELGGEEGQPGLVGQEIGELVRKEFDGILVPGVRGDEGLRYSNIVMFRPEDRWHTWLRSDAQPYELK